MLDVATSRNGLGKLELPVPPMSYVPSRLRQSHMEILPVQLEHTLEAGRLPSYHKDPFDRLLIAQAKAERLRVITYDTQFDRYGIEIVR